VTDLLVLVPAPVLGPASWQPVADELTAGGARVTVPSLADFTDGDPPYAPRLVQLCTGQIAAALAAGPGADRVVLVVHSGAGPFAAQLAAAVPATPAGVAVVFADAGLPAIDGPTPVMDGGFLPYLRQLARDGMVPPWPQWFPEADPAELYPSETARAAVLSDARPVPLSFFGEQLPAAPAPAQARYLLFSEGYGPEAEEAKKRGWPVAELPGSHLHMLVDPAAVAAALVSW
jgi:hypothetical protein